MNVQTQIRRLLWPLSAERKRADMHELHSMIVEGDARRSVCGSSDGTDEGGRTVSNPNIRDMDF